MKEWTNYNLKNRNTFGIEAKCRRFVEIETVEEAVTFLPSLTSSDMPLLILGGGSNLLLTADYPGTIVRAAIHGIQAKEEDNGVFLTCGAGEVWDDVVDLCVKRGWYGAENLSLIPGDVGASAVQNIGAYGAEAKDLIHEIQAVEVSTGNVVTISAGDCDYGYRDSRFKHEWQGRYLITHVTYKLSYSFNPKLDYGNIRAELERKGILEPTAQDLRQTIIDIRRSKLPDPAEEGNAGSFFVNPVVSRDKFEALLEKYPNMPYYEIDSSRVKIPAGWLIEQCGWKGKTLGRAGVHSKQALVLVNKGGAEGWEILLLCDTVREDVKRKFGIEIHSEVNIV